MFHSAIPERCEDAGCPNSWHLRIFDWQESEFVTFLVGTGESALEVEGDGPTAAEELEARAEYLAWVSENGEDPLDFAGCAVPAERERTRRFRVRVAPWIGQKEHGPMLIGVRRDDHTTYPFLLPGQAPITGRPIPQEVWDYLGVVEHGNRWTIPGFGNTDELEAAIKEDGHTARRLRQSLAIDLFITVTCKTPVHPPARQRGMRQWAAAALIAGEDR